MILVNVTDNTEKLEDLIKLEQKQIDYSVATFYVSKDIYEQALLIKERCNGDMQEVRKAIGPGFGQSYAVNFMVDALPDPLNFLAPFINLVQSEKSLIANVEMLTGILHEMSLVIDFVGCLQVDPDSRENVPLQANDLMGYKESWESFLNGETTLPTPEEAEPVNEEAVTTAELEEPEVVEATEEEPEPEQPKILEEEFELFTDENKDDKQDDVDDLDRPFVGSDEEIVEDGDEYDEDEDHNFSANDTPDILADIRQAIDDLSLELGEQAEAIVKIEHGVGGIADSLASIAASLEKIVSGESAVSLAGGNNTEDEEEEEEEYEDPWAMLETLMKEEREKEKNEENNKPAEEEKIEVKESVQEPVEEKPAEDERKKEMSVYEQIAAMFGGGKA